MLGPELRQNPRHPSAIGVIQPENGVGELGVVIERWVGGTVVPVLVVRSVGGDDGPAWMPRGRAAFMEMVKEIERGVGFNTTLVIWPTASGAVSDAPSLRTFLAQASERGREWMFLLDPEAMLTPEMSPRVEDHFARWAEELGGHAARWGTMIGGGQEKAWRGAGFAELAPVVRFVVRG